MTCYVRTDGISARKWAKKKKVCYQTIYMAIQRGISVDDSCTLALKRKGRKDSHVKYFVGKQTLRAYCLKHNLKYDTVLRRLRRGISIGKAIK